MTEWRYLWGSVDGSTSEKSIYDPCPPGWKVPTGDMYYYLLKEYENTEYGVYCRNTTSTFRTTASVRPVSEAASSAA